jgi:hypothetical protein
MVAAILGPTTTGKETSMKMTEDELMLAVEREVNAKIDAELQAKRARERADIAARYRHEEAMAHLDEVNRRHPIQGLGDPKVEEARRKAMDERAAAAAAKMDAINQRPVPGSLAHQRSLIPGDEGLTVRATK